jgi:upstream activation factor subunit UAF30
MDDQIAETDSGFVYVLTIEASPDRVLVDTAQDWPCVRARLLPGDGDGPTQYELGYIAPVISLRYMRAGIEEAFQDERLDTDGPLYAMDLDEAVDGIDEIKLGLYVLEQPNPYTKRGKMKSRLPDAVLSVITGAGPMAQVDVTKRLWQYIKVHGLQDQDNLRMINSDERFLAVFEKKQFSMFEMTKLANKHLS